MRIIGVVGLPGAGKSLVASIFATHGACVIDVDKVGHAVLEEEAIRAALRARFGEVVAPPNAPIDRHALGAIVFADPAALADLEALVHPRMAQLVRESANAARQTQHVILDAALLYRMQLDQICDSIIHVTAPFALRLARVRSRGWDEEELKRRDAQLTDVAVRAPDALITLCNESTPEIIENRIVHLLEEW